MGIPSSLGTKTSLFMEEKMEKRILRHVMQPKLPKDEGFEREQLVVSILRTLSNKHVRLYIGWVII